MIIKGGSGAGTWENAPEGTYRGVLVDVVDLGEVLNKFNGKMQPKVRLMWQLDCRDKQGKPLRTSQDKPFFVSQQYTASLFDMANLRPVVENMLTRNLTTLEVEEGFDLDELIGTTSLVTVKHNTNAQGKTFANVTGVVPPLHGMPALEIEPGYTRMKDRPQEAKPSGAALPSESWEPVGAPTTVDADIPF